MMAMMQHSCRWARSRLALMAGDDAGRDLGWEDRRLVERHLIGCSNCRRERASLAEVTAVLRQAASVAPASPAAPSIWPALSRQIRGTRHPRARSAPWFGIGFGSALGLAAGVVVAGGAIGLAGWQLGSSSRSRPELASSQFVPRPALPVSPDAGALAKSKGDPKADGLRLSTGVDPKTSLGINPSDPQRSQ